MTKVGKTFTYFGISNITLKKNKIYIVACVINKL